MIHPFREVGTSGSEPMETVLAEFGDVSMELLQARALLKRVDRKYLLRREWLEPMLLQLNADYRLLRAAGQVAATYQTRYFDTADRHLYQDHRRGRRPRYKVRLRHHVDRRLSFLEIKCKGRGALTAKAVLSRPFGCESLDAEALRFIDTHCPYPADSLRASVANAFQRVTLVGESVNERLTVDWDLEMADDRRSVRLPGLVIVEIKQARYSNSTPAARALRHLHVREGSISEYCLATARLATVRTNTFKPALRAVERFSA